MVAEWTNLSLQADKIRVKVPEQCYVGEIVEIRTLIKHVMETGNRKDTSGHLIPKHIIQSLKVFFDQQTIFNAEFGSGISENPFISFWLKVSGPGKISFVWEDDRGEVWSKEILLNVI